MGYIYSNMWTYNYNLDLDVSKLMGFNRLKPQYVQNHGTCGRVNPISKKRTKHNTVQCFDALQAHASLGSQLLVQTLVPYLP